jgi:hypothetical protein
VGITAGEGPEDGPADLDWDGDTGLEFFAEEADMGPISLSKIKSRAQARRRCRDFKSNPSSQPRKQAHAGTSLDVGPIGHAADL